MLPDILSEERSVGEAQNARNFLNRLRGRTEIIGDVSKGIFRNPFYRRLTRMALADDGEILGRNAQLLGKIFYRLVLDFALLQHLQKLVEKITRAGDTSILRQALEKQIAHGKKRTLEQRLYDFTTIWLPGTAVAESRVETETHQIGKLGIEYLVGLVHLQYRQLADVYGTVPYRDIGLKDVHHAMIADAHCSAQKVRRHLYDIEHGIRWTDKNIALLYYYFPSVQISLQRASETGCNHVHLQPHGVGILQYLEIVDNQDILVEIASTDLGTLSKLTFLDALPYVLLFLH